MRLRALALRLAFLAACLALPGAAFAHRAATSAAAPAEAISIPNLGHGQMAAIARHRAEILDLAARQTPTDPTMRRLEGFASLQFFACFWGLAPGSVEDEASPFNECAHAYLAATRALLLHLQTMPGDQAPVRALIATIEREMLENGASLVLCRYSDEPFNTAQRISPHWSAIPSHPPTWGAFAGGTLLVAAGAGLARGRLGRARSRRSAPALSR